MAGMLRLHLVLDLCTPLIRDGRLTREQYESVNMAAIVATANREPDWWDEALVAVGTFIGEDGVAMKARAARVIATSDAIRYTQIGNPEKIVIKSRALLRHAGYDFPDANQA